MATVTVTPATFELINFDAGEVSRVAEEVADKVGVGGDVAIEVNVDEAEMLASSTTRVEDGRIVVDVSGGAFESLRKAREFDETRARTTLGLALMRARDRLDPSFGDPPPDDELAVDLESAWSTYIEGRLSRLGVIEGRPQRRIYHFRVRHGFSDRTDAVFNRLWSGDGLTWQAIVEASREAEGDAVPA
ncbi:MAG TPA: hypothetical protein VHN98_06375 [Acidimicrobiales bacterium]|nr:hypothetical protein [Acidimicrobiales bacterium]